jgi:hypothetical protein
MQMDYLKSSEQILYFVDLAISAEGLENPFSSLIRPHPYVEIHKSRQVRSSSLCLRSVIDPVSFSSAHPGARCRD